jgi:hypothetical protein
MFSTSDHRSIIQVTLRVTIAFLVNKNKLDYISEFLDQT